MIQNLFQLQRDSNLYRFNSNLQSLENRSINNLKASLLRLKSFYLLLDNKGVHTIPKDALDAASSYEDSIGIPTLSSYDKVSLNAHLELLDEVIILVDTHTGFLSESVTKSSQDTRSSQSRATSSARASASSSIPSPSNPNTNQNTQQQQQQQPAGQAQQQQQQRPDNYIIINLSTLTPLILPLLFLILKCSIMLYIFCRHGTWTRKLIMATLTIGYSVWEATRFIHIRRHTVTPHNNNNNNNNNANQQGQGNQNNNGNDNNYDAVNQAAHQALNNPNNASSSTQTYSLNPFDKILDTAAHINLTYEAQRLRIPPPVPSSAPLPPFPQTKLPHTHRPPRQPQWWTRVCVPFLICILTLIPEVERRRSRALKWRYSAFKSIKHNERERKERERERVSQGEGLLRPPGSVNTASQPPTPSSDTPEIEEERVAEEAQVDNWEE